MILLQKLNNSTDLQRKILEDLRESDCSKNNAEEAVQEWLNKDVKLECYNAMCDIMLPFTCGSETEQCPATDDNNLIPQRCIGTHTEALLNYFEQEDNGTP